MLKRNETSGGSARALQVDAPHFLLRNMDRPGQNRRNHSDKYKHPSGTAGDRKTYLKMKRVNTPPDISPMMCSSDIVPSRRYPAMGYLGSDRFESVFKKRKLLIITTIFHILCEFVLCLGRTTRSPLTCPGLHLWL